VTISFPFSEAPRPASNRRRSVAISPLRLVAFALLAIPVQAPHSFAQEQVTLPLSIVAASGAHNFSVEVMRTEAELEKGLMFRKSMPADHGMLFDFKHERSVMMWMKNTYIPLDLIFIAKTGRVVGVVADARPMSEQILGIAVPADAVLELDAGTAAKIGLKTGDMVHNSIFTP